MGRMGRSRDTLKGKEESWKTLPERREKEQELEDESAKEMRRWKRRTLKDQT